MKYLLLILSIGFGFKAFAQQSAMPHGMVYGIKPDTSNVVPANHLDSFMDQKVRISTTIKGKVLKVTKPQGGWFELDAGKGKVIAAHFNDYKVVVPTALTGKIVMVEGVAQKQFAADGKKQSTIKIDPKRNLVFEVKGLMVYK